MVRRVRKDTWKQKKWYKVLSPSLFSEVEVADTIASDPDNLIGRRVEVALKDVTGDIKQSKTKLLIEIDNVAGTSAKTRCAGFELSRSYIRSLTRRRVSRVDPICDVTTKDGALVRVKCLLISNRRIRTSLKQVIRAESIKILKEEAKELTRDDFIKKLLEGAHNNAMKKTLHKIYPIRRAEVYKLETLRYSSS